MDTEALFDAGMTDKIISDQEDTIRSLQDRVGLFQRQLDKVDDILDWKGTGLGRVGSIEKLQDRVKKLKDIVKYCPLCKVRTNHTLFEHLEKSQSATIAERDAKIIHLEEELRSRDDVLAALGEGE